MGCIICILKITLLCIKQIIWGQVCKQGSNWKLAPQKCVGQRASSGELFRSLADRTEDQLGVESEGKSSRCCQTFCPKQLDKCGFYLLSLKLLSRGVSRQFGRWVYSWELGLKHPSPFVRDHPIVYQKKDVLIEKNFVSVSL